ncbi:hypothetical protein N2152v2_009919 [Parachlorella kessleri]
MDTRRRFYNTTSGPLLAHRRQPFLSAYAGSGLIKPRTSREQGTEAALKLQNAESILAWAKKCMMQYGLFYCLNDRLAIGEAVLGVTQVLPWVLARALVADVFDLLQHRAAATLLSSPSTTFAEFMATVDSLLGVTLTDIAAEASRDLTAMETALFEGYTSTACFYMARARHHIMLCGLFFQENCLEVAAPRVQWPADDWEPASDMDDSPQYSPVRPDSGELSLQQAVSPTPSAATTVDMEDMPLSLLEGPVAQQPTSAPAEATQPSRPPGAPALVPPFVVQPRPAYRRLPYDMGPGAAPLFEDSSDDSIPGLASALDDDVIAPTAQLTEAPVATVLPVVRPSSAVLSDIQRKLQASPSPEEVPCSSDPPSSPEVTIDGVIPSAFQTLASQPLKEVDGPQPDTLAVGTPKNPAAARRYPLRNRHQPVPWQPLHDGAAAPST